MRNPRVETLLRRMTLEEMCAQIASVDQILADLDLTGKPRVYVFNKIDRIEKEEAEYLAIRFNAVTVSALDRKTLLPLLDGVAQHIFERVKAEGLS